MGDRTRSLLSQCLTLTTAYCDLNIINQEKVVSYYLLECLYDLTTVVFADRTRSKFTIDCWSMFNFDFNSSKCCCKVQRTCKQVSMELLQ